MCVCVTVAPPQAAADLRMPAQLQNLYTVSSYLSSGCGRALTPPPYCRWCRQRRSSFTWWTSCVRTRCPATLPPWCAGCHILPPSTQGDKVMVFFATCAVVDYMCCVLDE